jgi:hypothetical protein
MTYDFNTILMCSIIVLLILLLFVQASMCMDISKIRIKDFFSGLSVIQGAVVPEFPDKSDDFVVDPRRR